MEFADIVRAFCGRRVLVIGDAIPDVFACGRPVVSEQNRGPKAWTFGRE